VNILNVLRHTAVLLPTRAIAKTLFIKEVKMIRKNDLVAVSSLSAPVKFGTVVDVQKTIIVVQSEDQVLKAEPRAVTKVHEKNLLKQYGKL